MIAGFAAGSNARVPVNPTELSISIRQATKESAVVRPQRCSLQL